jgi:hypothetical protein
LTRKPPAKTSSTKKRSGAADPGLERSINENRDQFDKFWAKRNAQKDEKPGSKFKVGSTLDKFSDLKVKGGRQNFKVNIPIEDLPSSFTKLTTKE